jgi:hypothetical protein
MFCWPAWSSGMMKPKPFTELKNLTRPALRVFAVDDILNLTRTTRKGIKREVTGESEKKIIKNNVA